MGRSRTITVMIARVGVIIVAAALAVLGLAAQASAHVTVNPSTATQGGYAKLTFRVPNEKSTASTVRVEVVLPEDAPIPSLSTKPVAGWTAQVQKRTLATPFTDDNGTVITEVVGSVVWTAAPGADIAPGQFQEFDISAGPLPKVDQIVFKALQTYSDGEIVRWIDEPHPGVELEKPAPVLRLQPGTGDAHGDDQAAEADGSGLALGFGVAGAVLGLAGLVLGLLAYRRTQTARS